MGWSQGLGRRTYGCTGCSCDNLRQISARCISPEEAKAVHNASGVVVRQDVQPLETLASGKNSVQLKLL